MPARRLGQRVDVVAQHALLPTGQVRVRQLPRQSPIPLRTPGKHQQMRPRRIRLVGAADPAERQLGTEHGGHVEFPGRLGEPHHPVEPVVIGQGQGTQTEPGRLLHQFLRRAGAVEKAVGRMGVQLGIGHRNSPGGRWTVQLRGPVLPPLARPRRAVPAVAGLLVNGPAGPARPTIEHALHLGPARRTVVPPHRGILSNLCSTVRGVLQALLPLSGQSSLPLSGQSSPPGSPGSSPRSGRNT